MLFSALWHIELKRRMNESDLFLNHMSIAIDKGWPDADGRSAMIMFMNAALDVCSQYSADLEWRGLKPENYMTFVSPQNLGGQGVKNNNNSRYAIRQMEFPEVENKEDTHEPEELTFDQKVAAYRDPELWVRYKDDRRWIYKNYTPDVITTFIYKNPQDLRCQSIGLFVGEAKMPTDNIDDAEDQVCALALRGLLMKNNTAGLIMNARGGRFIEMNLQDGFIYRKRKSYGFNPLGTRSSGPVDSDAYRMMFQDLVLYLWSNHFEGQYNR